MPAYIIAGLLLFTMVFLGYQIWLDSQPESSGAFEMTGLFVEAQYSGSLCGACGEEFNTTEFQIVVTVAEAQRVESQYTKFARKLSYSDPDRHPGMIVLGRESTGNWCGPQPPHGALVTVSSTSGFTKDVVVKNVVSGQIYRPTGSNCPRVNYQYHYIVFDANNVIFGEGTVSAPTEDDAWSIFANQHVPPTTNWGYQVWKDGDPVPTPYPGVHR